MKTQNRFLLLGTLGLIAALPLATADQRPHQKLRTLAAANEPDQKFEKRIVVRHGGVPGEMQKVAFLGVETAPVAPELSAQLSLPAESGLVVRHVVPDSPAAPALKQHDVLLKLDDQLLIDSRQLAVLVRNKKAGDEVTLTYCRGGKEATAKVKLGEHELPKIAFFGAAGPGDGNFEYFVDRGGMPGGHPMGGEDLNRTLALLDRAHAGAAHRIAIDGPGFHSTTVNTANSNMVFSDEQGSLELTIKDGKKTLIAKNAKGESLYSGSIDTPEQRKALPEEVRARLEKIEGMQELSFHTEFDPGEDVLKVAPRGIALPLRPEEGAREAREGRVL